MTDRREAWAQRQLAAGKCRSCGKKRAVKDPKYCRKHRDHLNAMARVQTKAPHRMAARRAWASARYKLHKSLGLCVYCHRPAASGVLCQKHSDYFNAWGRKNRSAPRLPK